MLKGIRIKGKGQVPGVGCQGSDVRVKE